MMKKQTETKTNVLTCAKTNYWIQVDIKPHLEFVCGAAACSLVDVGGRECGAELSLLLLHSFRQRCQLPLQQQLLQSTPLLYVQDGLRLLLQQLITLLLNLPHTNTFI